MKVLITGASSGIGRDLAREFEKLGYELILVARDKEKMQALKKELKTKVKIIAMDLSIADNCIKLYKEAGSVDILINNAGFGEFGEFINTDLEKEIKLINTNITAVHILTKLYMQDMYKKNSGKILNVASIAGCMPGPLMDAYYASKSYVIRLSEGIRAELKKNKSNVHISVLCPGPVNTNFNNVAGVKFNLRSLSSEKIANYTTKKLLKNKFWIVPGIDIKILRIISKVIPDRVICKGVYFMQEKKRL